MNAIRSKIIQNTIAERKMAITPEQLAKSGTEHGHQAALFCWIALNIETYPELNRLFHIQNASANRSARVVGVKAGVPDLFLPVRNNKYFGLFIELKRPQSDGKRAGKVSKEQDEWITQLLLEGFGVALCYGWEAARDMLIQYLKYVEK